jgi:hypothetical protein
MVKSKFENPTKLGSFREQFFDFKLDFEQNNIQRCDESLKRLYKILSNIKLDSQQNIDKMVDTKILLTDIADMISKNQNLIIRQKLESNTRFKVGEIIKLRQVFKILENKNNAFDLLDLAYLNYYIGKLILDYNKTFKGFRKYFNMVNLLKDKRYAIFYLAQAYNISKLIDPNDEDCRNQANKIISTFDIEYINILKIALKPEYKPTFRMAKFTKLGKTLKLRSLSDLKLPH